MASRRYSLPGSVQSPGGIVVSLQEYCHVDLNYVSEYSLWLMISRILSHGHELSQNISPWLIVLRNIVSWLLIMSQNIFPDSWSSEYSPWAFGLNVLFVRMTEWSWILYISYSIIMYNTPSLSIIRNEHAVHCKIFDLECLQYLVITPILYRWRFFVF